MKIHSLHFSINIILYSLVEVLSLSLISIVTAVDDGLLRTSTGLTGPSSSTTLYVVLLNDTITTIQKLYIYSYMLNKNGLAVKKCEANQKQQWL